MSRTRVYTVMMAFLDLPIGPAIFIERQEAEQFLAECRNARLMETDLDEQEHADLCLREMQAQAEFEKEQRTGVTRPGVVRTQREPTQSWTDCSTRPAPPTKRG